MGCRSYVGLVLRLEKGQSREIASRACWFAAGGQVRAPAPAMARARFGDGVATTAVEGAANCPCRKDPGRSQRWEMV